MKRLRAGAAVAAVLAVAAGSRFAVLAPSARAGPRVAATTRVVSGPVLARELRRGRSVGYFGMRVAGTVDLRGNTVRSVLSCRRCVFEGPVFADRTIFSQVIDLSGSWFYGPATFNAATFAGDAAFDTSEFRGEATFERATFRATVGFSDARFARDAFFARASFHDRPDFSGAFFGSATSFSSARLAAGASFRRAAFRSPYAEIGFDRITSNGRLDFDRMLAEGHVNLVSAKVGAPVSFRDVAFGRRAMIELSDAEIDELVLSADDAVEKVDPGDRKRALTLVETTAKTHGEAAMANDADYALHALDARDDAWPFRVFDLLVYRWVAGYLVRPLRPLVALLLLAAFAAAVRHYRRRSRRNAVRLVMQFGPPVIAGGTRTGRSSPRSKGRAPSLAPAAGFAAEFWDTLATIAPRRWSGAQIAERSLAGRLEVLTYRVLFVCLLVARAKTNPGLHDMIDALS